MHESDLKPGIGVQAGRPGARLSGAAGWASALLGLLVIVGLGTGCGGQGLSAEEKASAGIVEVDVERAAELITGGDVVVLDIRTPREFRAGHMPGATNVDYRARDFEERLAGLDRDGAYLMHCASGVRSGRALELFRELGFRHVYHLDSGFEGWRKSGLKVTVE
jgi:rhodanese-related sulfurtransferase